jgi:pyruvate dehydrogenase E1 component alpha subunit
MSSKKRREGTAAKTVTAPDKQVGPESFSLISNEKLVALYANLVKWRIIAERVASLPKRGKANGTSPSIRGYEAGSVGVAIDLGPEDAVCSLDHGLITGFGEGAPIDSLLLWSALTSNGLPPPTPGHRNGSGMSAAKSGHAHTQAAIGAALANKTRKNGKVAVVFGKESASESWREAIHIATVHALPMIFVLRDNRKIPGRRASDSEQFEKAKTPLFPIITVDSNDVVAVYRVANEAISRARLGRGPTLIECQPFLLNGNGKHSHDPILNMENYLRGKGLFRPETKNEILKASTRDLARQMKAARGQVLRPER